MSETSFVQALDAQIAQRLFGWRCDGVDSWHDAQQCWHRAPPAYTTDPAATALVWQWVETRGEPLAWLDMDYSRDDGAIQCSIHLGRHEVTGFGATWPEALCRAALALADALEGEKA